MSDAATDTLTSALLSDVDAVMYRCRNDDDYTMEQMIGRAEALTGYPAADIVDNRRVSWAKLMHPEDAEAVVAAVDAAVEARKSWDVAYRLMRKGGEPIWVRERGAAVFDDDRLTHLQGMVVEAGAEIAVRQEAERSALAADREKKEIVEIAQQILNSIQSLSMLAVNARIEAARSGEAGKGFAIVAGEIATLAEENGSYARRITDVIKASETSSAPPKK